jgi:hypothetical protein
MNWKTTLMAAAVTGLLAGAAACDKNEAKVESTPKAQTTTANAAPQSAPSATPAAAAEKHSCKGQNACKGQGGCKESDKHACKGQNDCKGQGGCKGA